MLRSFTDFLVKNLGFEAHLVDLNSLQRLQYCGPGTQLEKRLARGDPGLTPLDRQCKEHDIAYSQTKNPEQRRIADKKLHDAAKAIYKDPSTRFGEKINAYIVRKVMGRLAKGGAIKGGPVKAFAALRSPKKTTRRRGKKQRTLPIPQHGGFIPIPVVLGALAAITSTIASIKSAVDSSKRLSEQRRHDAQMEENLLKGKGLGKKKKNSKCCSTKFQSTF